MHLVVVPLCIERGHSLPESSHRRVRFCQIHSKRLGFDNKFLFGKDQVLSEELILMNSGSRFGLFKMLQFSTFGIRLPFILPRSKTGHRGVLDFSPQKRFAGTEPAILSLTELCVPANNRAWPCNLNSQSLLSWR